MLPPTPAPPPMPPSWLLRGAANPYVRCFARGVMTAGLRTTFFKLLVYNHLWGLLVSEWLMSHYTSRAVGHRAASIHLRHYDRVWAFGAVTGVALALYLLNVIYHPEAGLNPFAWSMTAAMAAVPRHD